MITLNTGSSYLIRCNGRPPAEDIRLSSYPTLMTGLPHGSFRSWRAGIRVFGTYEQSGVTCVGLSNTTVFGTFYA